MTTDYYEVYDDGRVKLRVLVLMGKPYLMISWVDKQPHGEWNVVGHVPVDTIISCSVNLDPNHLPRSDRLIEELYREIKSLQARIADKSTIYHEYLTTKHELDEVRFELETLKASKGR